LEWSGPELVPVAGFYVHGVEPSGSNIRVLAI
jgi:hypothetical protein